MRPTRQRKGPGESFIVTSLDGAKSGLNLRPFLWGATLLVVVAFILLLGVLRMQHPSVSAAPPTATPGNTTAPAGSTLSNP